MKKFSLFFASLLAITSFGALAAKPEKKEKLKKERIVKENPVQELCIKPFKEQHSLIREDKKSMFAITKESFRSGEISEADLRLKLEEIALEAETKLASLEADKEICLAQFEEVEEVEVQE